jgi:hypothetical protein
MWNLPRIGEEAMNASDTAQVEMFLACVTGVLLIWWKLRQTIAYLANHKPGVIFPPRPRPAPRKIEPLTDVSWALVLEGCGIAPRSVGDYRDDSEAAA